MPGWTCLDCGRPGLCRPCYASGMVVERRPGGWRQVYMGYPAEGPRVSGVLAEGTLRAALDCGWALSEVALDAGHRDESGWWWGPGERLWWCTDGADSVTVRAPDVYGAVDQLLAHGMPPKTVGKLNWSALRW